MNILTNKDTNSSNNKSDKSRKLCNDKTFPIFLLVLIILAYGLLTSKQGFYLDDWYILLFKEKLGSSGFLLYFSKDRPFESYPYILLMSILGESPLGWSIFAILMRWTVTFSFWILLKNAFPEHKTVWKWATVIFAVYPGFKFHWFGIMFSFFYLFLLFYILSYIFMLKAIENANKSNLYVLYTLAALVCLIIGILPQEYFYGMELFRPIFIFLVINKKEFGSPKKSFLKAVKQWIPYLIFFVGFTVYRILFRNTYAYQIGILDQLRLSPLLTIKEFVFKAANSIIDAFVISWWNALKLVALTFKQSRSFELILLIIAGFGWVLLSLYPRKQSEKYGLNLNGGWKLMLIGLYLGLVALIPFYAGGFDVRVEFPWNRFLLALTPAVAIFSAGFLDYISKKNTIKVIILALICSIAVASQFITSSEFVNYWERQKEFFWQLSWRVPQLKAGTTLITVDLPFVKYYSGTSLIGPLNIIYFPEDHSTNIYAIVRIMDSPESAYIPEFTLNKPIVYNLRGLQFEGSTNQLLLFSMPEEGCLRIFAPYDFPDQLTFSNDPYFWTSALPLSNLGTIITNPSQSKYPPEKYFGTENTNHWCYYFEKADLARQNQDWEEVIYLYESAQDQGLSPYKITEFEPLVEAYIRTSDVEAASQLVDYLHVIYPNSNEYFCNFFLRLQKLANLKTEEQLTLNKF